MTKDQSGASLTFGAIENVKGTPFFTVPVQRLEESAGSGSYFKGGGAEVNRIIVDSRNGISRRVLPDEKFVIVNWILPSGTPGEKFDRFDALDPTAVEESKTAPEFYAAVVKRPGKEEDDSRYDVLLGRFDTGQQTWIARNLDGVAGFWRIADGRLAMIAATDGRGVYRLYDTKTFGQVVEKELKLTR
ncbi:MAG: hypothetical protein H0V46_07700 [Sphingomonas sp.]|nr:hypothetical protein [Sphingomonas sp.]